MMYVWVCFSVLLRMITGLHTVLYLTVNEPMVTPDNYNLFKFRYSSADWHPSLTHKLSVVKGMQADEFIERT
jgi:hypothetical protein